MSYNAVTFSALEQPSTAKWNYLGGNDDFFNSILTTGWIPAGETWVYSSVDDPTGVITISGDQTTKYSIGMKIRFVNGGNTIYGKISKAPSYSAPNTTITFLHEIDPSDSLALTLMANSAITAPYYSMKFAPYGFPMGKLKWSVKATSAVSTVVNPSAGVWTNQLSISTPIGIWKPYYSGVLQAIRANTSVAQIQSTLSTANNTESDSEYTIRTPGQYAVNPNSVYAPVAYPGLKEITNTAKTTYYLNTRDANVTETGVGFRGDLQTTILQFESTL